MNKPLLSLLFLFSIHPQLVAQEPVPTEPPAPIQNEDPATPTGLDAALLKLKAVKGKKGAQRQSALTAAAEAFEALLEGLSDSPPALARAAYEAGECRRRLGALDQAEALYSRCISAQKEGRYTERAVFQRASMRRRLKQFEAAIEDYRKVTGMRPDSARAHEARVWIGRSLKAAGDDEAAETAFREALAATSDPVRKIGASDRLARHLIDLGKLDDARSVLSTVENSVAPEIEKGGKLADRIRKALDRRSAPKRLQKQLDRENGAGADAARLERDRARGNRTGGEARGR